MTTGTLDLKKVKDIIFSDIEKLLDSFDLEYTQDGDNIFMCCPAHEGSDNPQGVSISMSKEVWRCWTRGCHETWNTDIFGFIGAVLQTDSFSQILKHVSQIYNLNGAKSEVEYGKEKSNGSEFSKIVKLLRNKPSVKNNEPVASLPTDMLKGSPYFESRGFHKDTLEYFGVNDSNSSVMKHRSIIPISYNNTLIGYIARATKDWLQPKYLFSEGFKKANYLYNYDNAIEMGQLLNCLFLVEGQGDVWKLYESGVFNAVGLFGKEISRKQKSLLLQSGITTLVILTDNDQVGRESKIKIRREMGRMFKLVFPNMPTKDLGDASVEKIQNNILKNLKGCY